MSEPRKFQTVAISRVDGGLTVVRILEKGSYTIDDDYIQSIIDKYVEGGCWINGQLPVSWRRVPNDFVSKDTDRTYRNAWKDTPGHSKPDHDMSKAREIQRIYLRMARLAEFCRLDNEYRIADETNNIQEKMRIGAEKQAFRDVTEDPRIEAAQTVEELKLLRLDYLLPEITKGEKYMDKMRFNTAYQEQATATPTQQGEENGT